MNIIEQVAFDVERLWMNAERAEARIAELEAQLRSLYEERRRAALDRMVEIADESGMYHLPPLVDQVVEALRTSDLMFRALTSHTADALEVFPFLMDNEAALNAYDVVGKGRK